MSNMYYSYKCTYCGREFYTYDSNREQASITLYRTIKQHLIDYNEDHKEHEMDDGEQADSNQIYNEMIESKVKPAGGYEANQHTGISGEGSTSNHNSESDTTSIATSHSSATTLIILVLLIIFVVLILLFPGVLDFVREHLPQF